MAELDRAVAIACLALITDPEDRILLVRQNYGGKLWALPGGMAESGESLAETARREVLEETGLDVELEDLVVVADRESLVLMVFRGTTSSIETSPQESEIDECRWFSRDDLPALGDTAFGLALHLGRVSTPGNAGLRPVSIHGGGGSHTAFSIG